MPVQVINVIGLSEQHTFTIPVYGENTVFVSLKQTSLLLLATDDVSLNDEETMETEE
jgi:hypothetical protein